LLTKGDQDDNTRTKSDANTPNNIQERSRVILSNPFTLIVEKMHWPDMYRQVVNPSYLGGEGLALESGIDDNNIDERIFSMLPIVAELLWSPPETIQEQIDTDMRKTARRLGANLCRLSKREGIRVAPLYPDYCGAINSQRQNNNGFHSEQGGHGKISPLSVRNDFFGLSSSLQDPQGSEADEHFMLFIYIPVWFMLGGICGMALHKLTSRRPLQTKRNRLNR